MEAHRLRHVVLTRSAYGPAWDREANARRLEVTRGVTVASMAAQSSKDWTWIVAVDRADPLLEARKLLFASAGVPVRFLEVATETDDRSQAAAQLYRAPWNDLIGPRDEAVAMTRLDDDDALAPWAVARIGEIARRQERRTALVMPLGMRVYAGRLTIVRHNSNAMQTLVTPPGDTMHVYDYKHRQVRTVASLRPIETHRLAWVWSRHPDTISGWHEAALPLSDHFRELFAIDWSLFGESTPIRRPVMTGAHFR